MMINPEAGWHARTDGDAQQDQPQLTGRQPQPGLTCGIREAQLAKSNPLTMNARYTDRRAAATARPVG
jgi:hypothetical protein